MASLSDLNAWKDRLIEARLSGVRRVRDQNGEEIEYRSDSEYAAALAYVERLIAAAQNTQPHTIIFRTSKGLDL